MGIFDFFKNISFEDKELEENDICPNCWSAEEYQDQFQTYAETNKFDHQGLKKAEKLAFIQKFIHTHVKSIQLTEISRGIKTCPKCTSTNT